jgi:CubicO group peptidase (beta-lactamase class C family)
LVRSITGGALVFLIAAVAAAAPPDDFIDSLYTCNDIAGVGACAWYGDSLIWQGYFGTKNFEYADSLVNESTLFYHWWVSMPITAIAFMQQWELGLVDLDEDINTYLPYSIRNPNHPTEPITPRMILCHMGSLRSNDSFFDEELAAGDTTYSNTGYAEQLYSPGGLWYSSENFYEFAPEEQYRFNTGQSQAIIAAIVEQVSTYSDSFELQCRESIFDPLGMAQTTYLLESVDTLNTAIPYVWHDGEWIALFGYPSAPCYAGRLLRSTPLELARPLVAVMLGGELDGVRILEEATVDTMLTIQYLQHNPSRCLGWRREYRPTRVLWGHYGNIPVAGNSLGKSVLFFCAEENSAVIVVSNGCTDQVCTAIMDMLFDYVQEVTGIEGDEVLPEAPAIVGVFPNPFSAWATISFELPQPGPATLGVYDFSGRLIDTPFDAVAAAGQHVVDLDGSSLLPGVYLLRLDTGTESSTARCLLLR